MAAATGILLLLIFPVVTPDSSSDLLQTVIGALEKMVHYYKENYMDLNIDGLFGLRVLEGHMESILQEYASGKHKNLSIQNVNRIKKMLTEATQVCKDAIEFVKRDDEEYYNTMSYVIGQPWSYFLKHKQVEPDLRWHPETYLQHKTRILDETTSDNCMSELIGSQSKEKCKISEKCAKIMTTKGLSGYGITHQILWTMLADQAGCGSAVEEVFQKHGVNISYIRLEFCTNNLIEMTDVVHGTYKGVIIPKFQDLFLEQQFVCPSLGYYQFLSKKYLEDILTWQNLNGCFGEFPLLEKSNIGQKPVQLSLSQKLLKAANGTRVQDIAPGNSLTANNMKTIQQKDIYRKSNILLNKLKADSKPGTIDEKVLKHVTVNIDQFPKVVKSPTSNISLKQNGNVVIQAGGNLIGKFQDNKNLGSDIGLNQGLNFGMDKNQISQRKLLSVSSSMFDSVNRHQFSNLGFKKRNLLAEKRMKDGCLAHKTAVAAGALMMYLRYILDPGPLNLRTDPEEFRQRFLMSNEFNDKVRSDTNVINKRELNTDKGTDKEKQVTGKSRRHKHDGVKEGALNNNILAAQLHGMDREGGNYYQDDGDYKEKGYENEMYPQNEDKAKHLQRLVQFDNNQMAEKKKGDDYDEDDYDDDQDDNEADGNYEYQNNHKNKKHQNKNQFHEKHDKQQVGIKPDDTDYTYYDQIHKHDDYNNENEEEETANKNDKAGSKNMKDNSLKNAEVLPEKLQQDQLDVEQRQLENKYTPKTFLVFIVFCSFVLLIVMYKFIKNRRIHIKYHPRSFLR